MMLVSNKARAKEGSKKKKKKKEGYFCLYVIQSCLVSSRTRFFSPFAVMVSSVGGNHIQRSNVDLSRRKEKRGRRKRRRRRKEE